MCGNGDDAPTLAFILRELGARIQLPRLLHQRRKPYPLVVTTRRVAISEPIARSEVSQERTIRALYIGVFEEMRLQKPNEQQVCVTSHRDVASWKKEMGGESDPLIIG